jgi:hypothetical protein
MEVKNQELEKQVLYLSRQVTELRAENKLLHGQMKLTKSEGKDLCMEYSFIIDWLVCLCTLVMSN